MHLEWLEDILAVAETGSFSDAADRRRLTHSAFSRRIRAIEAYVGVELFDRGRKPVALRPVTAEQRDRMVELAGGLRQLLADLRRGDRLSGERIVISCQHSLTASFTPELAAAVARRLPTAKLRVRSANRGDCLTLLLSREADLAFVYRLASDGPPIRADYVDWIDIGEDRLVPVFRREGAEAVRSALAEGRVTVVAYPQSVFFGEVLAREVLPTLQRRADVLLRIETALTLAGQEMAAGGVGVAWIPLSLARRAVAEGRLADLSDCLPSCDLRVSALRLAGRPSALEAFAWEEAARLMR